MTNSQSLRQYTVKFNVDNSGCTNSILILFDIDGEIIKFVSVILEIESLCEILVLTTYNKNFEKAIILINIVTKD